MRMGYTDAEYISFKNLRHVFATHIYARTKDLVLTQRMLRHRSILTTQRYVHMICEPRHYDVRVVKKHDSELLKELLAAGYDVVMSTPSLVYLRRPSIA